MTPRNTFNRRFTQMKTDREWTRIDANATLERCLACEAVVSEDERVTGL
jgi:hypothetical protein